MQLSEDEYPTFRPFRDYNAKSESLISVPFIGDCLEKAGFYSGDIGVFDKAVDIISGDFVMILPLTKVLDPQFEIDTATKRIERCGDTFPRHGGDREPFWWFGSSHGLIRYMPEHHEVVGRLVMLHQRRRDLPELFPDECAAYRALATPEYRLRLNHFSQPAQRALKRNGLDRTTVFRKAAQAVPGGIEN